MSKNTNQKIETKSVKHTFSGEEKAGLGGDLARAIAGLRGIEAEFDQVKASYKARTSESEARIDKISTDLMNGFEMRQERCIVVYRPADRKKDYYIAESNDLGPVLTEDMTPADFQAELIQAEADFERKAVIQVIPAIDGDSGQLIVGRFSGKWYSALRVVVGRHSLDERLNPEAKACKQRFDAIQQTADRLKIWLKKELGKDAALGFDLKIGEVVAAEKEKVE